VERSPQRLPNALAKSTAALSPRLSRLRRSICHRSEPGVAFSGEADPPDSIG
jgi:hypothetical protein